MIIANPIYDSVFKYLLEDIEISKGLLSTAIADRDLRIKMNLEDEIERTYGREMNELVQKLIDKDTQLADKDNELEKLRKELERLKMEK
jgi:hypothetical protein